MPEPAKPSKPKRKKVSLEYLNEYMPVWSRHIYNKTGLRVQDPTVGVGCGRFGCVYLTDDPKWVVKVTRDPEEGPLCQRIVEIRSEVSGGNGYGPSKVLPGIIFFKDIFRTKPVEHHRKTFSSVVIIRENVRPAEDHDLEKMTWYIDKSLDERDKKGNRIIRAHPGLNIAMLWARQFHVWVDDAKTLNKAAVKYVEWLSVVQEEFPLITADMLSLMDPEYNLMLMDVHAYNVGYSTTDWGKSYRPPGSAIIYDVGMNDVTTPRSRIRMLNPLNIIER